MMENIFESEFFHMTCPNCGANMKIDHGSLFKCEYCKTEIHVFTSNQIEALGFNFCMPEKDREWLKECGDETLFYDRVNRTAAEKLAEHLLKNGYVNIVECLDHFMQFETGEKHTRFVYMLKVVKPEQERIYEKITG